MLPGTHPLTPVSPSSPTSPHGIFKMIRPSKYRHVYGTEAQRGQYIENIRVGQVSSESSNLCKANLSYLGVVSDSTGGGSFLVVPREFKGRIPAGHPYFNGHSAPVLDLDFSPFDDQLVCSSSEDATVKLWRIESDFAESTGPITTPLLTLNGHLRKVHNVLFHPTANNVVASMSYDQTLRLWDLQKGCERVCSDLIPESLCSVCFNWDGSILATSGKDKQIRLFDSHTGQVIDVCAGHSGVKPTRIQWLGDGVHFATTGFSRISERQLCLWDSRYLSSCVGPVQTEVTDRSSGLLMPFYDQDTQMLFLAGKGDGNVRYWEYAHGQLHFLSEHHSTISQKGMAMMPKRGLNVDTNEIARLYKVAASHIEPISFTVPRKDDNFQADIYPPTICNVPAIDSKQFFDEGMNAIPFMSRYNQSLKCWIQEAPEVHNMPAAEVERLMMMRAMKNIESRKNDTDKNLEDKKVESVEQDEKIKNVQMSVEEITQVDTGVTEIVVKEKAPISNEMVFDDKPQIAAEVTEMVVEQETQVAAELAEMVVEQDAQIVPQIVAEEMPPVAMDKEASLQVSIDLKENTRVCNEIKASILPEKTKSPLQSSPNGMKGCRAWKQTISSSLKTKPPVLTCYQAKSESKYVLIPYSKITSGSNQATKQKISALTPVASPTKQHQIPIQTATKPSRGQIKSQRTNKVSNSSSSNVQKLPTKTEPIPIGASSKFKQDNGSVKVDYRSVLHPIRSNNEKWSASEACKTPHICPDCQAEIASLRAELQALKGLLALN